MDSRTIEQIAADWLAKRDSGNWTEEDEAAFESWQRESTLHWAAVIRLRSVWQHADRLQALGAGVSAGTVPPPGQWRVSPFFEQRVAPAVAADSEAFEEESEPAQSGRWRRHRALAAAALLAFIAGIFWYSQSGDAGAYRTSVGDIRPLQLKDGSRVTLNTDSVLRVVITSSERKIELDRGEAFFDVARDPVRPFVVQAGDKRVVAVGTRFSVLKNADGVRVIVTEGEVRLEDESSAAEPHVRLTAGSIAHAGAAGVLVTSSPVPEVERALSWRAGYIMLRDTALSEAVAEFNRYNKRQLEIGDPELADLRIGGNLRLTNVDAFVRVLERGFPVRAELDGERIVLRAK